MHYYIFQKRLKISVLYHPKFGSKTSFRRLKNKTAVAQLLKVLYSDLEFLTLISVSLIRCKSIESNTHSVKNTISRCNAEINHGKIQNNHPYFLLLTTSVTSDLAWSCFVEILKPFEVILTSSGIATWERERERMRRNRQRLRWGEFL